AIRGATNEDGLLSEAGDHAGGVGREHTISLEVIMLRGECRAEPGGSPHGRHGHHDSGYSARPSARLRDELRSVEVDPALASRVCLEHGERERAAEDVGLHFEGVERLAVATEEAILEHVRRIDVARYERHEVGLAFDGKRARYLDPRRDDELPLG